MVPNISRKNKKRIRISKSVGRELRIDCTSLRMPGIELIVLKGRRIRMTLIPLMLLASVLWEAQPRITTMKSS